MTGARVRLALSAGNGKTGDVVPRRGTTVARPLVENPRRPGHARGSLALAGIVWQSPSHGVMLRGMFQDPLVVELVKGRYFARLAVDDSAHARGIFSTTTSRHWNDPRPWIHQASRGPEEA